MQADYIEMMSEREMETRETNQNKYLGLTHGRKV